MEVRHQRAQLDAERVPVVGLVEGALDERLDEVGGFAADGVGR